MLLFSSKGKYSFNCWLDEVRGRREDRDLLEEYLFSSRLGVRGLFVYPIAP